MANIKKRTYKFTPKPNSRPQQNLQEFVLMAKSEWLPAINAKIGSVTPISWDDKQWEVGDLFMISGNTCRMKNCHWTTDKPNLTTSVGDPFPELLGDLFKAIFCHEILFNYTTELAFFPMVCRGIHDVLLPNPNPLSICADTFHDVLRLPSLKNKSSQTRLKHGTMMSRISMLLNNGRLITDTSPFIHGVKHVQSSQRTGKQYEDQQKAKVPDRETVLGAAKAFNKANTPQTEVSSSILTLLFCTPARINEVLKLPRECLRIDTRKDKADLHKLLWHASKNGEADWRDIPTAMTEVLKKALERLDKHSTEARKMAKWYEKHPTQLYLPKEFEHLRENPNEWRPALDFCDLLGFSPSLKGRKHPNNSLRYWRKKMGIPRKLIGIGGRKKVHYRFADIEKAKLSELPKGFPVQDQKTGLKYSEALLVLPQWFFRTNGPIFSRCMLNNTNTLTISTAITGHCNANSLFEKLDIRRSDNGEFVSITTHQARHYLNKALQENGKLSQELIALISGRAHIGSNETYAHVNSETSIAQYEEVIDVDSGKKTTESPVSDEEYVKLSPDEIMAKHLKHATEDTYGKLVKFDPISDEELAELQREEVAIIYTEFGICPHEYGTIPCNLSKEEYLLSPSHIVIKGLCDQAIRDIATHYRIELDKAEMELKDGTYGAPRWVEYYRRAVPIFEGFVEILDDPEVKDGVLIKLKDNALEYSPFIHALECREQITGEKNNPILAAIRKPVKELPDEQ